MIKRKPCILVDFVDHFFRIWLKRLEMMAVVWRSSISWYTYGKGILQG